MRLNRSALAEQARAGNPQKDACRREDYRDRDGE
jgi:hypothetical protein